MNSKQKTQLFKQSIIDYLGILVLWVGLFLILPLAFMGPSFDICHGLGSTCSTADTTRWYWFGGYHAIFGPDGPHYPAEFKYWPTSTWEMWLLVFVSLLLAILLYFFAIRIARHVRRKRHDTGQD